MGLFKRVTRMSAFSMEGSTCFEDLSEVLLAKAEIELKETKKNREKGLKNLKKALAKQQTHGIRAPTDDSLLLLFLRARKFNPDRAHELLQNYYNIRLTHADLFEHFTPLAVKEVFQCGIVVPLPRAHVHRPLTVLVRVEKWDASMLSVEDIFKGMLITIEYTIRADVANQIAGYNFIFDMNGLGFSHVTQFTPMFAHRALGLLENGFPVRVKGLHHIHVPSLVESVFQVFRPFLSGKMRKRFAVTSSPESVLCNYADDELPESLGGTVNMTDCTQKWTDTILSPAVNKEFFDRGLWIALGRATSLGQKQLETQSADALDGGVTGMFRRLEVE